MLRQQKEARQKRFMQNRTFTPDNTSGNILEASPESNSLVSQPLQSEEVINVSVERPGNVPIAAGSNSPPATLEENREDADDDLPARLRRREEPANPEEFVESMEVQEALLTFWKGQGEKRKREVGELAKLLDECKVGAARPVWGNNLDVLITRFAAVDVDAPRPASSGQPEDAAGRNTSAAAQSAANTVATRVSFSGFRSQLFPSPSTVTAEAQTSVLGAGDNEHQADEPEGQGPASKKFRKPPI